MQHVYDARGREKENDWGSAEHPMEMFKHISGNGGISQYHLAGCNFGGGSLSSSPNPVVGNIIMSPFVSPGGRVDQLACRFGSALADSYAYVGIYDSHQVRGTLYPRSLVVGSSELFVASGSGATLKTYSVSPALVMKKGEVYWSAQTTDGATQSFYGTTSAAVRCHFGAEGCYPYVTAICAQNPYGALPAIAPYVVTNLSGYVVALGLRYVE